eukprot:Clim_evm119s210 gene=Clim_evmTU119s210
MVKAGDQVPAVEVQVDGKVDSKVSLTDMFAGKKGVLFAMPGAFTPTCTAQHYPGFVKLADEFAAAGYPEIVCITADNAFAAGEFQKFYDTDKKVKLVTDPEAKGAIQLEEVLDAPPVFGHKVYSRFALVINDGKIIQVFKENGGGLTESSAENVLKFVKDNA